MHSSKQLKGHCSDCQGHRQSQETGGVLGLRGQESGVRRQALGLESHRCDRQGHRQSQEHGKGVVNVGQVLCLDPVPREIRVVRCAV